MYSRLFQFTVAGISWDGPPLFQSTRLKSHHQAALKLIKMGKAYYCFCSKEKIAEGNDKPEQKTYLYDGRCRNLSRDEVRQNFNRQLPAGRQNKVANGDNKIYRWGTWRNHHKEYGIR